MTELREMTMREYFEYKLMEEVRRDAEKEGIKLVETKSKPTLVADNNVVKLERPSDETQVPARS